MMLTRRGLLGIAALGTAGLGLTACGNGDSNGNGGGPGAEGGPANLRLAWWGNPTRNEDTEEAIAAWAEANPDITLTPEQGEWGSYWDRLATQTAGNDMPDILQMDMAYIREYGDRGALLDLSQYDFDTSKFAPGTAEAGKTKDGLVGVNCGVNAPVLLANPAVFKAARVDLPDDDSWTWEDLTELSSTVTSNTKGKYHGISGTIGGSVGLEFWLRQAGKALFTEDGLGFDVPDVVPFFTWVKELTDVKGAPSAAATVEDEAKATDQQMFATGKVAMCLYWSNQVSSLDAASGQDLTMLKMPSATGTFADTAYWYKASMLWSASSRTENPEAAAKVIDFLVNQPTAVKIIKAERGMPPNLDMRKLIVPELNDSDKKSAAFLEDVTPGIKDAPIPPLPGNSAVGDALSRQLTDLTFGKTDVQTAATTFVNDAKSGVQV